MGGMQSCEDFLTVYPTDKTVEEDFWKDKNDLSNVRTAAYAQLSSGDVTGKILLWGEARSDNFTLNRMDNTSMLRLQSAVLMPTESMFDWASFYTGINYCNLVIQQGDKMMQTGIDPSFTVSDWRPIKAEMQALKALYYFYLIRAYRDVPYVNEAVTTDEQALRASVPATSGIVILGDLIDTLEVQQKYASENFGTTSSNKGRFTRRALRTLLADMYLWRGCMLQHFDEKGDSVINITDVPLAPAAEGSEGEDVTGTKYQTADGTPLTKAYADELSQQCFARARELCAQVVGSQENAPAGTIMYDFKQKYANQTNISDEIKSQKYPLIQYTSANEANSTSDEVFDELFSAGNSLESVLELQYDGVNNSNSAGGTYLTALDNGSPMGAIFTVNATLVSTSSINPDKGWGKTDMRMAQTARIQSNSTTYLYMKNMASMIIVDDIKDIPSGVDYSYRSQYNGNWPVYRLSDVMLIWAEATARYYASQTGSNDDIKNAYEMVDLIFTRSNPGCSEDPQSEQYCQRVIPRDTDPDHWYANSMTSSDLLKAVYRERQREFVGEGKFWFDVVRQAEFTNDPQTSLTDYMNLSTTVKNRLKQLASLYNPIYNEEIKVNTMLVQNPVWERYNKK